MEVLNEFLRIICNQAHENDDLHTILRDFLEPDTNDKKISGGPVIRTVKYFLKKRSKYLIISLVIQIGFSITDRNHCESIEIWNENDKKYARHASRWYVVFRQSLGFYSLTFQLRKFQVWQKFYWAEEQLRRPHFCRTCHYIWIIRRSIRH